MNWHMAMALGGIRLQVPDSQVVRALEVLDDFVPEDAEMDEDGEMETSPAARNASRWRFARSRPTPRQIALWSAAIRFPTFSRQLT